MEISFEAVPPESARDPRLRADLLDIWVAVTNAGGSVGFTAPSSARQIAPTLDVALARVAAGHDALGVLRAPHGVVGMGLLVDRGTELCRHWRTVLRVMVHPDHQGTGAGLLLMQGLHLLGRQLGLEHLLLSVRDGQGTEGFYARLGYTAVGRHRKAIRVAPGDDRDEIMLVASLVESSVPPAY